MNRDLEGEARERGDDRASPRRRWRKSDLLDAHVLSLFDADPRPLTVATLVKLSGASEALSGVQLRRVLARLIERGAVERVELLAGYWRADPRRDAVAVCTACGGTKPLRASGLTERLAAHCRTKRFRPARMIREVRGFCATCRDAS